MNINTLEADLRSGVLAGITPGLAAAWGSLGNHEQNTVFCAGRLGFGLPEVNADTIYDLSSLTKVLSTMLIAAYAMNEGKLDLDECPWPNWSRVKVRDILQHTGGLPAWAPFFEDVFQAGRYIQPTRAKKHIIAKALATKPVTVPRKTTIYTDIGFIGLGALLEERLGAPLDVIFSDISEKFYGSNGLIYVDLASPRKPLAAKDKIAPTERLRGQVHDDNCFAMGGVSGHAGLFGSLNDVTVAARKLLECLMGSQTGIPAIIRYFANEVGLRALGFDRPTLFGGSTGGVLSKNAVGHLGFTGTSLWLDPRQENNGDYYVLLTNRVYYGRQKQGIMPLRAIFHQDAKRLLSR